MNVEVFLIFRGLSWRSLRLQCAGLCGIACGEQLLLGFSQLAVRQVIGLLGIYRVRVFRDLELFFFREGYNTLFSTFHRVLHPLNEFNNFMLAGFIRYRRSKIHISKMKTILNKCSRLQYFVANDYRNQAGLALLLPRKLHRRIIKLLSFLQISGQVLGIPGHSRVSGCTRCSGPMSCSLDSSAHPLRSDG